ncbi:choice-of-anchor I family protein [Nocardioides sp. AX2bis]|uniref:choice-of-anchor I family protein n=1 Tax=Nocardioides sp. AX2bis TaxID=2653157 RepID=UPI0012F29D1D|nr:choice-of-anchor I family protein [Nocardioides sp. AX2bis]VXB76321.1 Alkaline phosphatase [Nocardioides sp. AX2bis]
MTLSCPRPRPVLLAAAAVLALSTAAPALAAPADDGVALTPRGTHVTGQFDESAAEIVEHDPRTQRYFVVNALSGAVDVLDARDPDRPTRVGGVTVAGLASADGSTIDADAQVNSVAVQDGLLAAAVEAGDKVSPGWVAFFRTRGDVAFLGAVRTGVQPDNLTFTPDGAQVVTANEAEPADDFSVDPAGSVGVVDVERALAGRQGASRLAGFRAFGGDALPDRVRVYGPDVAVPEGQRPAGRVARNLEPEYVTVDASSRTAYLTVQEANTVAAVDLRRARVRELMPLGTKDWTASGAGLDASDRDGAVNQQPWDVSGLYLPDSIASYEVRGTTYLVTANEGDAREWGDYVDSERLADSRYPLCADAFPDAEELLADEALGRLNVSEEDGIRGEGEAACREEVVTLGGRSFSIWTTDGEQVYDSGSRFESLLAGGAGGVDPAVAFNATNDDNDSFDNRSDDKGPEPEGVTLGKVGGRTYAFVGLERVGGVMTFDVTTPRRARFVDYVNARDFSAAAETPEAGDLGPEGLAFVSRKDSPVRRPLLAVGNEVSGTTTVFSVGRGR